MLLGGAAPAVEPSKVEALSSGLAALNLKDAKKKFEADFLRAKLAENEGNVSRTAEQIGMERSNLHKKIKQYGLE